LFGAAVLIEPNNLTELFGSQQTTEPNKVQAHRTSFSPMSPSGCALVNARAHEQAPLNPFSFNELGKGGQANLGEQERIIRAGHQPFQTPVNGHERQRPREIRGMDCMASSGRLTPWRAIFPIAGVSQRN
jgi:hypothetical protein